MTQALWLTRNIRRFGFCEAICFLEKSAVLVRVKLRICGRRFVRRVTR